MSDTPSTIIDELDPASAVLGTDLLYMKDANGNDLKATMQQVKDFTMPDPASVNTSGLVNTAAQAFSGKKTFTGGIAASSAEISGNESVGGDLDVSGAITQNGQPLITDVEISEAEGNALEKKEDGLYVSQAAAGLPIGTIILNPLEILPPGFLRCNGETYLKADYPELYGKLPAIYIIDENSFKVPDYRDRVAQGANGNLNELIEAGLPNITGKFGAVVGWNYERAFSRVEYVHNYSNGTNNAHYNVAFDASKGETKTDGTLKTSDEHHVYGASDTVQPPAIAQDFIIKATNFTELQADILDDTRTTSGNVWSASKTKAEIDASNIYSTEETVIGTWIDGKPIYRRVWNVPNVANGHILWQNCEIDSLISVYGSHQQANGERNALSGGINSDTYLCCVAVSSNNDLIVRVSRLGTGTLKAIVEYTKTTD